MYLLVKDGRRTVINETIHDSIFFEAGKVLRRKCTFISHYLYTAHHSSPESHLLHIVTLGTVYTRIPVCNKCMLCFTGPRTLIFDRFPPMFSLPIKEIMELCFIISERKSARSDMTASKIEFSTRAVDSDRNLA